jgi:hypothetical protein
VDTEENGRGCKIGKRLALSRNLTHKIPFPVPLGFTFICNFALSSKSFSDRNSDTHSSLKMSAREKDQTTPHHQPFISSLVVRPSVSGDGGGGAGADGSGGGRVSDYEPGEVRREPPPYSRSDRFSDEPGSSLSLVFLLLFIV